MYVISGLAFIGFLVGCGVLFVILADIVDNRNVKDETIDIVVSSGIDSKYSEAKALAGKATELLALRDSAMYKDKASLYRSYMSDDLWNQFFFSGGKDLIYRDISIRNIEIKGHIFSKGEYLFKIDTELTNAGVLSEFPVFVRVDNGILTQIYTQ